MFFFVLMFAFNNSKTKNKFIMLKQIAVGLAIGIGSTLVAMYIWDKVKENRAKKAAQAATK